MQDVGQNGAHAGHGGRHVCAGALVQTESSFFFVDSCADEMASPARWTHAALPQCNPSADPAAERQNNRKSVAASENNEVAKFNTALALAFLLLARQLHHSATVRIERRGKSKRNQWTKQHFIKFKRDQSNSMGSTQGTLEAAA